MAYGKNIAINVGSTWGTAVDCNVASECAFYYESFDVDTTANFSEFVATGTALPNSPAFGGYETTGTITAPFNYTVLPRLLILIADYTSSLVSSPEVHTFTAPAAPTGRFMTVAEVQGGVENYTAGHANGDLFREMNSACGTEFQLSGRAGETVMMSVGLLGDKLVTPASTNTDLTTAVVRACNHVNFDVGDADFFTMAHQGSPLNNVDISEFTFRHSIPRDGIHGSASDSIGLPGESGQHVASLEIVLRDFQDHQWIEDLQSKQALEAKFNFPSITFNSVACSATLIITNMRLVSGPATTPGPGLVGHRLTFQCYEDLAGDATNNSSQRAAAAWELVVNNDDQFAYTTVST